MSNISPFDVAIVAMSGQFPGARSVEELWDALLAGVELTSPRPDPDFSADPKQTGTGAIRRILIENMIDDPFGFDAEFFNVSPSDAKLTDPQHRLALECCYDALTRANIPHTKQPAKSENGKRPIVGLFASKYTNTYLLERVYPVAVQKGGFSALQSQIANDGDHLGPFIAYKLGLNGPVILVQNACSSSLVATHLACESLISGQCDAALVTAVNVSLWQNGAYEVTEGALTSKDGHCKPFSNMADGTVYANGVCSVVLKRLEDAVSDQSDIYAVIKGSAVNNDAERRLGYAVPSADGQKAVIAKALASASIDGLGLDFVECHGTGTILGDKIEIQALQELRRTQEFTSEGCHLSSVKANIGHLGVASGLVGLIKASMSLRAAQLPPQLNCPQSLPEIADPASGFCINQETVELPKTRQRYAGLSSFGLGGTNAHAILASWPDTTTGPPSSEGALVLPFSARTQAGLDRLLEETGHRLRSSGPIWAEDAARCLHHYREDYPIRAAVVIERRAELGVECLLREELFSGQVKDSARSYLLFSDCDQETSQADVRENDKEYLEALTHWKSLMPVPHGTPPLLAQRVYSIVSQCALATRVAAETGSLTALAGDRHGWISALLFSGGLSGEQALEILAGLPEKERDFDLDQLIGKLLTLGEVVSDCGVIQMLNSLGSDAKGGVPSYLNGLMAAALDPNAVFIEIGSPGAFNEAHRDFSASGNKLAFHAFAEVSEASLERLRAFLWCNGVLKLRAPVDKRGFRPALPVPELVHTHYEIPATKIHVEGTDGAGEELPLKQHLGRLWHEVFGIKAPIDDDIIFEHGATSLTIATFVETVLRELDVKLEIADIYEAPSFADQLKMIGDRI